MSEAERTPYPSDVSDEEWAFVAPYLALIREDAPQREHSLRDVVNGMRWIVRTGAQWRMMLHDLPPWAAVYQQSQRWIRAGVFEQIVHDLREILRLAAGRHEQPTAAILDGRTLQSTPESGARAGFDGHKKKKGSKVHMAVDTLGHLLAILVTPANEQERAQVGELSEKILEVTGEHVELAFVDQGYTGEDAASAAEEHGIRLEVVKLSEAKRGFVLLSRRWVVEIVFPQVTKSDMLALRSGRQHVADLDLVISDDDAIDEEHHELAPLLERGAGQALSGALAEGFERRRDTGQLSLPIGLPS
jgi:transposase